ncbi:Bug family tripartite tricarboxylate transporter substrate binding protein [Humitalea sp. 24SJ18S-53]|uniref:Bug family tripartite tricarboxylate transporter substrate binding protein n=1 Tax=Humitalea sp. 24SJ18S-53 TaxID=3422307 RepID=UPI003D67BF1C
MSIARRSLLPALAALPLLKAQAQTPAWPTQPLRFIVAYTAGGTIDVTARLMADKLSPVWGQPIVVENRTGAAGTLGANFVVRSPPDGHTLLIASAAEIVVAKLTQRSLPYDPETDLVPITLIARNPFALVVSPTVPAKTLPEFLAYARGRQLSYGSSGVGTTTHFGSELFRQRTGLDLEHVPYRGSAALMADLLAGRIQMSLDAIPAVLPFIRSGQLQPIGVATLNRSILAPEIPTLSEQGLEGFTAGGWVGALAPRQTPPEVTQKIGQDMIAAMRQGIATELEQRGFEPVASDAAAFRTFITAESARWAEVARRANIQPA